MDRLDIKAHDKKWFETSIADPRQGMPGQLIRPSDVIAAGDVRQTLRMALRGAGVTFLPLFSVIDAIRAGQLQRVLPAWRGPDIGVYALLPSRRFMDAKTRAWLTWSEKRISPALREDAAFFTARNDETVPRGPVSNSRSITPTDLQ